MNKKNVSKIIEGVEIPDGSTVYRNILNYDSKRKKIKSSSFKKRGNGMSVNWSQDSESTPEFCRDCFLAILAKQGRTAKVYGVVEIPVDVIRSEINHTIKHTPREHNLFHTDVDGEFDQEARAIYRRVSKWVIEPD